ncbi:MAG: hypothetical protein HKN65_12530, partial [Woeseiaceae bacterium]|nr:hypothetical protein [Woeseiaceae bacterium]
MFFSVDKRVPRALTSLLPALVLTGCFYGEGSGPTPLAGTPAPPPDPIPEGFCDVINFEDVCGPFDFVGGGNEPGFEGGVSLIIDNPDMSGLNATEKVVQMQKFRAESGKTFGGSTLQLPQGFDFSEGEAFTMLVWASRDVPINFKLEGLGQERVANQSGSSSWEELCFDFTGTAAGGAPVTGITFIFDVNELGDAAVNPDDWTFYYDEITQVESCGDGGGPGPGPATLGPVDFEVDGQGEAFAWTVFENDDNPPLLVIDNPDASGANTSARVAQFTARQAGQPFAGFVTQDLPTFTLDASNAIVRIKVWKSVISNVGIKFEDAATGSTGEILVPNTVVDQWEELEFDFSGVIGDPNNTDITGLVIFPDFDARAADNVVYLDDITFNAVDSGGGGPGAGITPDFVLFGT